MGAEQQTLRYHGKDINNMTKEELIGIIKYLMAGINAQINTQLTEINELLEDTTNGRRTSIL